MSAGTEGRAPTPGQPAALSYTIRRVVKHVQWARSEGVGRLIEEDRLDPRERIRTSVSKARWRARHGVPPGSAVPVYVVGLQRSGTNMLLRGLDAAPEVEVRGENDRTVFHRFRLRDDAVLQQTVAASRHAFVLVKPLCDSHRVGALLDLPGMAPGRAIWAYRDVEDRARSEVAKFGDSNLQALRRIAEGSAAGDWQAGGLPEQSLELIRSFRYQTMTPETAAALFWYVRNKLFFDLGLAERQDTMLSSYERLTAHPAGSMRRLCDFIGFPHREELSAHITPRAFHPRRQLDIDPAVRGLCRGLAERLDEHAGSVPTP